MNSHAGLTRVCRIRALLPVLLVLAAALSDRTLAQPSPVRVGSYAPALELADLAGVTRKVVWTESGPAATIVYFFDPQSSDCLLEMNFLDLLSDRARDFGLVVYAVEASGRQPAEVSRSMERYCLLYRDPGFPVLADPSFRARRLYGVQKAPTTFLTESHGVVLQRMEGYDHAVAVQLTRRVERLLRRERGSFSSALRDVGIAEEEEREIEVRLAAASAEGGGGQAAGKPLAPGERAPSFEYVDLAGRAGRWAWSSTPGNVRVAFFWSGLSLPSIEEMAWLEELFRRGRDVGLEILAVEESGLDATALRDVIAKYRRINPEPSFPIVADPELRVGRLFGAGDQLPQTFLLAADGAVFYRADGFGKEEAALLTGKIERAFALAGKPLPPDRGKGVDASPAPNGVDEAPSIRRERVREEQYRANIVQGDAYFMSWEFERALPHYLQALEVQPRDLHALLRTARIYERRGEPNRALEYWERVLDVKPDHTEAGARIRELRR